MSAYTPPGHTQVRILRDIEYAGTVLPRGSRAVLDADTAAKLIKAKNVEAIAGYVVCPQCGAGTLPEAPTAEWLDCGSPICGHTWRRNG